MNLKKRIRLGARDSEVSRKKWISAIAGLAFGLNVGIAYADEALTAPQAQTNSSTGESAASATATTPSPSPQQLAALANTCAEYDRYQARVHQSIREFSACDTVFPELGGVRKTLADNGFGFVAFSSAGFNYDLLGHNTHPQQYGGQDPTWSYAIQPQLTYDLGRLGVPGNAQLVILGDLQQNSYFPESRYDGFLSIEINQQFFNRQLELQYGYFQLASSIYGFQLGGNQQSALYGPQSSIPTEVGISGVAPAPSFMAIVRDPWGQNYYNKFIVSRSTSPRGIAQDIQDNPYGLRFSVSGDRPLFVDEFGYASDSASPASGSLWARVGAIFNTSNYALLNPTATKTEAKNYAIYAAVTKQIYSPHGDARGWYADAHFEYAPANVNVFARDYSISFYNIGPFPSRYRDFFAVSWQQSFFSGDVRRALGNYGVATPQSTSSLSISYAFNVMRGIYLTSSLTRSWNPSFVPINPPALFLNEMLTMTF